MQNLGSISVQIYSEHPYANGCCHPMALRLLFAAWPDILPLILNVVTWALSTTDAKRAGLIHLTPDVDSMIVLRVPTSGSARLQPMAAHNNFTSLPAVCLSGKLTDNFQVATVGSGQRTSD